MWLIQLGEVVFGGVGSGLYGMLVFAIIAVFVAGLMVGRTPEYLGKKIESYEMKMASLVILITPALVLMGTAIAVVTGGGHGRRSPTRASTGSAKSCTPSRRPATTTAAPSPASRRTRPSTTRRSVSACSSAATGWPFRCWRSPAPWPRRRSCRSAPGTLAHAHAALRRSADRRGAAGRGAHVRAGAGARTDRRALDAQPQAEVMTMTGTREGAFIVRHGDRAAGDRGRLRQADASPPGP